MESASNTHPVHQLLDALRKDCKYYSIAAIGAVWTINENCNHEITNNPQDYPNYLRFWPLLLAILCLFLNFLQTLLSFMIETHRTKNEINSISMRSLNTIGIAMTVAQVLCLFVSYSFLIFTVYYLHFV